MDTMDTEATRSQMIAQINGMIDGLRAGNEDGDIDARLQRLQLQVISTLITPSVDVFAQD